MKSKLLSLIESLHETLAGVQEQVHELESRLASAEDAASSMRTRAAMAASEWLRMTAHEFEMKYGKHEHLDRLIESLPLLEEKLEKSS